MKTFKDSQAGKNKHHGIGLVVIASLALTSINAFAASKLKCTPKEEAEIEISIQANSPSEQTDRLSDLVIKYDDQTFSKKGAMAGQVVKADGEMKGLLAFIIHGKKDITAGIALPKGFAASKGQIAGYFMMTGIEAAGANPIVCTLLPIAPNSAGSASSPTVAEDHKKDVNAKPSVSQGSEAGSKKEKLPAE